VAALPVRRGSPKLLEYAFDGLSATTMRLYAGNWRRFLEWSDLTFDGFFALPKADAAQLANGYVTHLARRRRKPATRKLAQQAIVVVSKRLYRADLVPWTLEGLVTGPRVRSYKNVEGISHEDWRAVLAAARADGTKRGARDVAVLLLLHDSGLRRREVATLDLEHYVKRWRHLWVWSKRMEEGDREKVPLNDRQVEALDAWVEHRGRAPGALFTALRSADPIDGDGVAYVVKYWCGVAEVPPVGPHKLRHAAITRLAREGASPDELMDFARHTNFDMTKNYIAAASGAVRDLTEKLGEEG
jgi:integrase